MDPWRQKENSRAGTGRSDCKFFLSFVTISSEHRSKENIPLQYPEGHLEAQAAKEQEKDKNGSKRKTISEMLQQSGQEQKAKKAKTAGYQLETELVELIQNDRLNVKAWDECKESLGDTKQVIIWPVLASYLGLETVLNSYKQL